MRAPTAYFLFAGEVRPEIQADIAAQNDGKVSVAAIGKAIGLRWKQLSEEDRQKYKDKAKELKGLFNTFILLTKIRADQMKLKYTPCRTKTTARS